MSNDTAGLDTIYDADYCARTWVTAAMTNSWIAGGFAWTGFDYKVKFKLKNGGKI